MDFTSSCRSCLATKEADDLYSLISLYEGSTLNVLIEGITNFKIQETDNLPQQICQACLEKFIISDEVRKTFLESQNVLKTMFEDVEIKKEEIKDESTVETLDYVLKEEEESEDENYIEEYLLKYEDVEEKLDQKPEIPEIKENRISIKRPSEELNFPAYQEPPSIQETSAFPCDTCPEVLPSKSRYISHLKKHRLNKDPPANTCSTCNTNFYSTSGYVKHTCFGKRVCYFCDISFTTKKEVLEHLDTTHRLDNNFYCKLPECNFYCTSAIRIFSHLVSHFEPAHLICQICSKTFTDQMKFGRHCRQHNYNLRSEQEYICDLCGSKARFKSNLYRHVLSRHLNRRFRCELCENRYFTTKTAVKNHQVIAHGLESPHVCPISTCGRKFGDKFLLNAHVKQHMKGGPQRRRRRNAAEVANETNVCDICERSFYNSKNLKRHHDVVHLKIKKFACPWETCSSTFGSNGELQVHYRQHTGIKPYQCSECPFKASDYSTVYKHIKNIHHKKATIAK